MVCLVGLKEMNVQEQKPMFLLGLSPSDLMIRWAMKMVSHPSSNAGSSKHMVLPNLVIIAKFDDIAQNGDCTQLIVQWWQISHLDLGAFWSFSNKTAMRFLYFLWLNGNENNLIIFLMLLCAEKKN